jgi:hypothetical protein
LRSKDLETHLNWFIHSFGSSFSDDSILMLKDKPTEETIQKLEKNPVSKINLGSVPIKSKNDTSVEIVRTPNIPVEGNVQKVRKMKFMPTGKGGNILKAAFGEKWFDDLKLEDSLDESNLQLIWKLLTLEKLIKMSNC